MWLQCHNLILWRNFRLRRLFVCGCLHPSFETQKYFLPDILFNKYLYTVQRKEKTKYADKLFKQILFNDFIKKSSDPSLTFIQLLIRWTVLVDTQTYGATGWTIDRMNRKSDDRRSPNVPSKNILEHLKYHCEYKVQAI